MNSPLFALYDFEIQARFPAQIETNLQGAMGRQAGNGPAANGNASAAGPSPSGLITQALESIARLNKGFKTDMATRTRPQIGAMFEQSLQMAIRIPQVSVNGSFSNLSISLCGSAVA